MTEEVYLNCGTTVSNAHRSLPSLFQPRTVTVFSQGNSIFADYFVFFFFQNYSWWWRGFILFTFFLVQKMHFLLKYSFNRSMRENMWQYNNETKWIHIFFKMSPTFEWVFFYWFGLVLWHINHCRLFNAKSFWYPYIEYIINILKRARAHFPHS